MTQTPPPLPADYTAASFSGNAINLGDLFRANLQKTGQMVVKGKTFEDCVIEGPAVMLVTGACHFDACDMGPSAGDPRNLMLRPLGADRVTGAIPFEDCTFTRCRFFAVGYTGNERFIEQMVSVLDANLPKAN